jgi:aryl-alcohol dehydrogenase-like predicted oxidoreductase
MAASIPRLLVKDPDLVNLRKAARAVLVLPALYTVLSWAFSSSAVGLFAFFAAVVVLVIADLSGSLKARAIGYVVLVARRLAALVAAQAPGARRLSQPRPLTARVAERGASPRRRELWICRRTPHAPRLVPQPGNGRTERIDMQERFAERLGTAVSEIGFGAWAIGGSWGEVAEADAEAALNAALDAGVTFIDTANVYGDGRSETIIGHVLKARGGTRPFVATKAGREGPNTPESYTRANLEAAVDRSLANLQVETLDLLQLHCPPTEVYYRPEVFGALDELTAAGKLQRYGVSVEKVEEGLKAIEYPGVASVQIIYNMFRQRPARLLLPEAKKKGVAVIVRVPLASGLLTGKMRPDTVFAKTDHRNFNREGQAFDVGETFAGVPYAEGLAAVEELKPLVPEGASMAALALRWILMNDAVTVTIPGAKNERQARDNADAAKLAPLTAETMAAVREIYERRIAPFVEQRW